MKLDAELVCPHCGEVFGHADRISGDPAKRGPELGDVGQCDVCGLLNALGANGVLRKAENSDLENCPLPVLMDLLARRAGIELRKRQDTLRGKLN